MKFNYQARDQKGEVQSGQVEASSREAAVTLLQRHGLYITFLEEVAAPPFYAQIIKIFERTSQKDIVLFSRQLAIMFKSRVPLVESLEVLAVQARNLDLKEKIFKISEEIEGGTTLSGALSKYPKIFSPFYIAMVRAGEASGKLSEALSYLAEHLERGYHLASKLRGAMIYPAMVIFVAMIVFALMMFYIIPQLTEVFLSSGSELPLITKGAISLSIFLKKWGIFLILTLLGLIIFAIRYSRTSQGKKFFDQISLRLPLVSELLKMICLSRFAENLSTLISGGLPIASALEISGEIVGNSVYREIIFQTRDEVRKGESISSILSRFPEVFPPVFTQMTLVGEKTGTLDKTLRNIVSFYQKEVDGTVDNLLSILEPALIIFLGLVVGGIMASVLLPLYQMPGI